MSAIQPMSVPAQPILLEARSGVDNGCQTPWERGYKRRKNGKRRELFMPRCVTENTVAFSQRLCSRGGKWSVFLCGRDHGRRQLRTYTDSERAIREDEDVQYKLGIEVMGGAPPVTPEQAAKPH